MLFIPLEKSIDWKNPPIVTITLILINVIFFFGFQLNDDKNYSKAMEYYFESGLSGTELLYYSEYLEKKNNLFSIFSTKKKEKKLSRKQQLTLFSKMRNDGKFLIKLESDEIIKPDDENYKKWKTLSNEFHRKRNKVTFYSYGLKSYKVSLGTLFSHMFLHANFEHLFWNMVFLFVFGFSVEIILGWKIYLPTYLLAGIGSGLFYVFLEPNSAIPGIGASGAISGLTGMYTVLFGMRKIRFFYFLFVFFDTVKAPAIIILPLWLGYELYSNYFIPTNINNLAHAGGLISGGIIAYLAKKFHAGINNEYMDENDEKEKYDKKYAEALSLIGALKIDKAKPLLVALNQTDPENIEVLKQLFNLSKFAPASDDFHDYARKILILEDENPRTNSLVLEVYNEYISSAKPKPKLNVSVMIKLSFRFLKANLLEDAEKIIMLLVNNNVQHEKMMQCLQLLINRYRAINSEKSNKYQNIYNKLLTVSK